MVEEVRWREVDATGAMGYWVALLEERIRERRGGEMALEEAREWGGEGSGGLLEIRTVDVRASRVTLSFG